MPRIGISPWFIAAPVLLHGCGSVPAPAAVLSPLWTTAAQDGQPASPQLWEHPSRPELSRVIAADEDRGLEVYALDGQRIAAHPLGAVESTALIYGLPIGGVERDVVVIADGRSGRLQLLDAAVPELPMLAEVTASLRVERLCAQRSPGGRSAWLFVFDERGEGAQLQLAENALGQLQLRTVRSFAVGGEVEACALDAQAGQLYVAEAGTAIWSYASDPEAELARQPLDVAAPLGALGAVTGLAVQPAVGGALVFAADAAGVVRVYRNGVRLGLLSVPGVDAPETVAAGAARVVVGPGESAGFALLALATLAPTPTPTQTLARIEVLSPRIAAGERSASVRAAAETTPVADEGDAADDPAIWLHPQDPALSLVIGSQKQFGVLVYDLAGQELQALPAGRINNVDLRDGFRLGGQSRSLVAGSNRTDDNLTLWVVDAAQRRLVPVGRVPTGLSDPYGLCLYHSARDGQHYAFVNDSDGRYRQFRLEDDGGGQVRGQLVREFRMASQPEGCVADDEAGLLYLGVEDTGLYRLAAEPDGGSQPQQVDAVGEGTDQLVADVEGMSLWAGANGEGWLLVSSQGDDSYVVYERRAPNRRVGKFRIVANDALGIDGAAETDGLDLTSAAMGAGYERGLLVVQDGRNVAPQQLQNFKLVPWAAVEQALGLPALLPAASR